MFLKIINVLSKLGQSVVAKIFSFSLKKSDETDIKTGIKENCEKLVCIGTLQLDV